MDREGEGVMYKLGRDSLPTLFGAIAAAQTLYLPADDGKGGARFAKWEPGTAYAAVPNTRRSAKDFFFPQTENLVDFRVSGQHIAIVDTRCETEDFVLFGVRACDVRSFDVLDRVFLADPVDTYYQNRRAHGTVLSMVCTDPQQHCFCGAFGIDAVQPGGDMRCLLTDDTLFLDPLTDKGRALADTLSPLLTVCDAAEAAAPAAAARARLDALPLRGLQPRDLTGEQLAVFRDAAWASLSEACLGCGACTFVCPTCQCYDIRDYDTGHGIRRFRCWDSCMYTDFTMMAAGTPRHTQKERFRQRFMHKLVYFPANNDGLYGCVGCGRCVRTCPVSMHIVKVMKAIGGAAE